MNTTDINANPTGNSIDRMSTPLRSALGTVSGVLSELTIGTTASAATSAS